MADFAITTARPDFEIEGPSTYIPMDRRHALAIGATLPESVRGAALFADIAGFTSLTATLERDLGPQRGGEEITRLLNDVYDAIISDLHLYGGSAISFGGDAVTCWFDRDDGLRATAAGLAMQRAMQTFATLSLALKVAIAAGPARRFVVGDPEHQLFDALVGTTIDTLARVEKHAEAGEVVLDKASATVLGARLNISGWREDTESVGSFAVVAGLNASVAPVPWSPLDEENIVEDLVRRWLVPAVYTRLRNGQGEFLAELRPVVALFMRFTGIDYDADESAGAKLDAFVRQVQEILAALDGTLLQVMFGDKGSYLYAAFGAPVAHEDDAYRAAESALKMRQLAQTMESIRSIQIGITLGVARTGAYGGRMRRTYGVLGDAVNLSARLMQAAAPAQILASKEVFQLLTNEFIWETLPTLQVQGQNKAVTVYGLLARNPQETQRKSSAQNELPMVGRERELVQIKERLDLAAQGRGQIVGVTADPGMGKSRLIAEVVRLADRQGWLRYTGECSSSGTNTSYQVWHTIWWRFFALDPSWPLSIQIRAIDAQLAQIDPAFPDRLPLLGAAMNLPIPDSKLTAAFDAKLRKSSLEALLVDCLRAKSQHGPILIVLEDCHWLDPLSHDLLDVVGKAIIGLPVLILLAFRSPQLKYLREPHVSSLAHYIGIDLANFTPEEARQLIDLRVSQIYDSAQPVPAELVKRITDRAEGNPFYVEELVDYLITRGFDPHDTEAMAKLDLPTSLQSLILSRIDQLAESQRITLKVASIIGRTFETPTLWGFYPQLGGETRVRQDLDVLTCACLIERVAKESDLTYTFRHVLMQEATYESLPFATRTILHEQLASFIENSYAHVLDQVLDQLAYHYGQSQNTAKKREYLLQAGQRAQQVYANRAAIDYYRLALPLLTDVEKPTVLLDLGKVQELVGSWQEAKATYEQARALAKVSDDRQIQAWSEIAIGPFTQARSLCRRNGLVGQSPNGL